MNPSSEQAIETLEAMRRQEECHGYYCVSDYFSELPTITNPTDVDTPVDSSCRFLMAKWCNEIADSCKYNRETAAIAMNCLDRFMSTPSGREILFDRKKFQLAAMTALYSSVKIHEEEVIAPDLLSTLSQGIHTPAAIEAMEFKMLNAIQWRVNVPTAMSFCRIIINDLIPDNLLNPLEKETILDMSKSQIELTVNEYQFSGFNGSSIAFACMLNAIECCSDDSIFVANFETTMGKILFVDKACITDLRIEIYNLLIGRNNSVCQIMVNDNKSLTAINSKESFCVDSVTSSGICSSPSTVATSI